MSARWSRLGVAVASAVAFQVSGCGEKRPGADVQFRNVILALKEGSLSRAYVEMLPSSYDRDLNEVLRGVSALLSEDDFGRLRDFAGRTGKKLRDVLAVRADAGPLVGVVARAAADLPGLLGLDDYASFRGRDVKGFLVLVDRGIFGEFARDARVRSRLEALEVTLLETKGDWAKLLFRYVGEDGTPRDELHEVILVDGKWVLNAWAVQWSDQVASWKRAVQDLEAAKAKDPSAVRNTLASAEALLEGLSTLVDTVLARLSG